MKTIIINKNSIELIKNNSETSLVLGFFDGIHLGHQKLIKEAINNNKNVSILTFKKSLKRNKEVLTSYKQKKEILKNLGIKTLYVLDGIKYFKNMNADSFMNNILLKINPKNIFIGEDFKFGKNNEGDINLLRKYFSINVVSFYLDDDIKVSSSKIKEYLKDGYIKKANVLLSRNFTYEGKVVGGLKNGTKILFPTINLKLDDNYPILKFGVYQTKVYYEDKIYDSITNIGLHPTINKLNKPSIESFIFDFNGDLYNKKVKLEFISYIREEKKFNSVEELKEQILKDFKKMV